MRVEVRLFANLADHRPGVTGDGRTLVDLPEGATVATLTAHLAIPPGLPSLVLVNGEDAPPEAPLRPGDVVSLLPPLAGG